MDVLVLIDKLDDLVHNAKTVPMTGTVRVDQEEIYDILDQMRATIPEEIKQARWIVKERQEMLAEAKREAERIVKEARERQTQLVSQQEVTKQAERAGRGHRRGRPRPRARDPPRRGGLRRRDPQHARGQPLEVHRRGPAGPRAAAGQGRAGRSRLALERPAHLTSPPRMPARRRTAAPGGRSPGCGGARDAVARPTSTAARARGCARARQRGAGARRDALPVNAQRARNGVPPLTQNLRLQRAAELHSLDMAKRKFFEHATPTACSPTRGSCTRATRRSSSARTSPGASSHEHAGQVVSLWMQARATAPTCCSRLPRDRDRPGLRGARAAGASARRRRSTPRRSAAGGR